MAYEIRSRIQDVTGVQDVLLTMLKMRKLYGIFKTTSSSGMTKTMKGAEMRDEKTTFKNE